MEMTTDRRLQGLELLHQGTWGHVALKLTQIKAGAKLHEGSPPELLNRGVWYQVFGALWRLSQGQRTGMAATTSDVHHGLPPGVESASCSGSDSPFSGHWIRLLWITGGSSCTCDRKERGWFSSSSSSRLHTRRNLGSRQCRKPIELVGPSTVLEIPGVIIEDRRMAPTGTLLTVVVVDLGENAVAQLRRPEVLEDPHSFDADQPFASPPLKNY